MKISGLCYRLVKNLVPHSNNPQRSLFPFLGLKPDEEERRRFRRASFTETAAALSWATRVLEVQENEIHHLLADLPLPLYLTTNFDSFMIEALQHKGRSPRRDAPSRSTKCSSTP